MSNFSGVATGGSRGQRKFCQKSGKEGENREKEGKIAQKRKNREGSFTLPLLTDRAGYATK